ncbi:MAG: fasciclin domain-containing protein [Sphingobacteriaceae bacterium]|nr:fasciclin domain-containing protein [Sphingobacteriaceae bacterium]
MKKTLLLNTFSVQAWFICLTILALAGCKKEPVVSITSSQVNITGYLEKNPEQFSEWNKIVERTGNAGFLQAYGNYTMFVPTNDGVKKYLTDMGKTSIEQLDLEELKSVVRFHLIEDTLSSRSFGDGKLNTLTMLGQYLITGSATAGNFTSTVINRQANVTLFNVRLGNGYVHVIDNVLRPAKLTLAQMVAANPDYDLFEEALIRTGLYDSLNLLPANNPKTDQRFLTVIAESDATLGLVGVSNIDQYIAKYNSGPSDLKSAENGFHKYVAYHILYDAKYRADLASSQAHPTLTYPEILTAKFRNQNVILEDMEFNGTYEPGVMLNKEKSDNSAINGVLHESAPYSYNYTYKNAQGATVIATGTTTGHFAIKTRVPFPVYWDVADMPETRASGFFRTGTSAQPPNLFTKPAVDSPSPVKGWNWPKRGDGFYYNNGAGGGQSAGAAWVFRDYLNLFLGNSAGNARQEWIEMKTPVIVRGEYRVWICYRRKNQSGNWPQSDGTTAQVRIDGGPPSPKVFAFAEPIPFGNTAELEALGWKYYTSNGNAANPWDKVTLSPAGAYNSPWVAKNVGLMKINTTGTHTLRMEALRNSQNANNLDMIHFIPKDWQSQILPRFMPDGTEDYTNYPGTH